MKLFDWDLEKNQQLIRERGISFEEIVFHITQGGLLDIIEHPNKKKYPSQRIFVVNVENYVVLVPFVESGKGVFLKTIIPSRKMTRQYLGGEDYETQ
ncbi:MAG: BrnT family toxin [Candidatus Omnitrophica bacterium]|nr:BrnT family toxin [Candidatus Omnitrophota bacterium]